MLYHELNVGHTGLGFPIFKMEVDGEKLVSLLLLPECSISDRFEPGKMELGGRLGEPNEVWLRLEAVMIFICLVRYPGPTLAPEPIH